MKKNYISFLKKMSIGLVLVFTSMGSVMANSKTATESGAISKAQQNKITVKGIVEDKDGSIIGANIIEKGTTNGVVTDFDGAFSISVDANATLVISYLGYDTQEIAVNGRTTINVTMSEDTKTLDEVVVVGYGVQKKVNLTGSVASVNFDELAQSRPVTSVSSALAGVLPGVSVMQGSGQPGSDGSTIRIRGIGTFNDSAPLVIIDGVEGVMDAVSPLDIESISVLKDAASGAIYGSRAANGVILITTKKGSKGKVNVNYSGRISAARPTNLINQVTDYADYMEYMNESFTNIGQNPHFAQSTIDLWREKAKNPNALNEIGVPNYVAFPNTDWQKAIFTNGLVHDHNVSLNGGGDKMRFLLSAGYLENEGLVENTGIKKYSMRVNLEANPVEWLKVGTRTFASQEDKDPGNFSDANNYLRQTTPGLYPRWNGKNGFPEAPEESATANSLFSFLNNRDGQLKKTRINTTLFNQITFIKGLTWDFSLNYQRRWDEERTWTNGAAGEKVKHSNGVVMSPATDPSQMSTSFYDYGNWQYTIDNIINYNNTFGDHDVSGLLGYTENYYYQYTNSASKKGLIDQNINVPGAATEMISIGGSSTDRASRSFFGRANYAYKSRYLLELNYRYDGNSRFHKDFRWGGFPGFSAGWRLSEEEFMEGTRDLIDNLKIRASYGELGNAGGDNIGNYEYQATYGLTNYSIGGLQNQGLASTMIANSMLTWESVATTDIGFDLNMLNNRLSFEFDYYNKKTTGILYRPNIYLTMGMQSAPRLNIAELTNKGIEINVGWQDRVGDFSYHISGNVSYNHNEITKYKGELQAGWVTDGEGNKVWKSNIGDVSTGGTSRKIEGKMNDEYYLLEVYKGTGKGYQADGIKGGPADGMIRTEQDMDWLKAMIAEGYTFLPNRTVGKNKIWYGDHIYADSNEDGIYGGADDNKFQNYSSAPKFIFGAQIGGSWKGIDVSTSWAGASGRKIYWGPSTGYNNSSMRVGVALGKDIADNHYFYDPENPNDPRTNTTAKYSRLVNGESGYQSNMGGSTLYLFNGDYLKLKNITVGYTFPKHIANKVYTQNIRMYFSGENLFTFTKFPGQDPELNSPATYTSTKLLAFGLNVTF